MVDYIDFYVGDWHWPTFNLADSWIIIGAGLSLLKAFAPDGKKKRQTREQDIIRLMTPNIRRRADILSDTESNNYMQVAEHHSVLLDYTLKLSDGSVADSTEAQRSKAGTVPPR